MRQNRDETSMYLTLYVCSPKYFITRSGLIATQTKVMAIVSILSRAFRISSVVSPLPPKSMAYLHCHFRPFRMNLEHLSLEVYHRSLPLASCLDLLNPFRPKSDLTRSRIWRRKAHYLYQRAIFAVKCSAHMLNLSIRTCHFWIYTTS